MEQTSHEQRIEKLIEKIDYLYSGLESLSYDDVKDIIRRSFYVGRKAGFLECKDIINSLYKQKFKGERRPVNENQETTTDLTDKTEL